jgi:hypothetical protein
MDMVEFRIIGFLGAVRGCRIVERLENVRINSCLAYDEKYSTTDVHVSMATY